MIHPRDALIPGEKAFPVIPACEHIAGSEKTITRSFELRQRLGPTFDITCDCEDGARPGQEKAHAEMVARLLGKGAGVRIHDGTHPAWKQDVDILVAAAPAYFTVPKVESARQLAGMIEYIEKKAGRPVPIHALIESHAGLADVEAIAALPSLQTLDFGLMDFVSAHHGAIPATALRSPGQFEHRLVTRAKARIAAAALAHGVVPSHNVTLDLKNPDTAGADARRARMEYGFLRMWSIHPSQIQPIVDAMKPQHRDVQDAAAILLAAQAAGWGPVQHAGEMHDKATYRLYWTLLQQAKMTGVALPPEAQRAFFSEEQTS